MSKSAITKTTGVLLIVIIIAAIGIGVGGYYYSLTPSTTTAAGNPVPNPDTLVVHEFGDVQTLDPLWN